MIIINGFDCLLVAGTLIWIKMSILCEWAFYHIIYIWVMGILYYVFVFHYPSLSHPLCVFFYFSLSYSYLASLIKLLALHRDRHSCHVVDWGRLVAKPGLRINWAPRHYTLSEPHFNFNLKIIVSLHINDFILLYNFLLYKKYTECILCHFTRLFFFLTIIYRWYGILLKQKRRVSLFLTSNFLITFSKFLNTQLYQ